MLAVVLTPAEQGAKRVSRGARRPTGIPALALMVTAVLAACGGGGSGPGAGAGGTGGGATDGGHRADGGGAAGVVIAAAGDIACPRCNDGKVADLLTTLMATRDLAAILPLGDNAYPDGLLADYQANYTPSWGRPALLAVTHPVPGNHDYAFGMKDGAGYFDYFNGVGAASGRAGARGQGYYSYDLGAWHVVALNTSDGCDPVACDAGSAELTWLQADLAASHAACTLAYFHHPRFQQGTVRGDTPDIAPLWDALYDAGADVVLSAHEHNYQQFAAMDKAGALDRARGIRSFVVGTGGTTGYYTTFNNDHADAFETHVVSTNGVLELTLRAGGYDWRFVTIDGAVPAGASGSGACH